VEYVGRIKTGSEKGKVTTPFNIALHMVAKLFGYSVPSPTSRILDAGCGSGTFVEAIIVYAKRMGFKLPEIVCVEKDPNLVSLVHKKFEGFNEVRVVQGDFLTISEEDLGGKFDYIISNPPYISYEYIDPQSRELYRKLFNTAIGRFDTYILFFEKALSLLKLSGRMVFITPEKFIYVLSASNLRRLLSRYVVEEIEFVDERAFGEVLAYPVITVIRKEVPSGRTIVKLRDGRTLEVVLPSNGSSWLSAIGDRALSLEVREGRRLRDLAWRISAGVATGRDEVYVIPRSALPKELEPYAYPTVSGEDLSVLEPGTSIDYNKLNYVMLIPYDHKGRLLSEEEAKPLIDYLSRFRSILEERYAVKQKRKKWYAFHEDPPLKYILRPKIIWRDIDSEPSFYVDEGGQIVPRHSVYYLVPKDPNMIHVLAEYLNSLEVKAWLKARCQRAANNYLRLQSHIISEVKVPETLILKSQKTLEMFVEIKSRETVA
jgi:tRNA1(Val) A37 N6-methylase TrmN6